MIKSPCIGVCTLEAGICIGCLRTIDEIIDWTAYADDKKREVLDLCRQRRLEGIDSTESDR